MYVNDFKQLNCLKGEDIYSIIVCRSVIAMYEDIFPERLAFLRSKKGVSARDMSLSLGQSGNYINMIENKNSFPSMTVFFYICEYLGITPRDFFDQDNENPQLLDEVITNFKKLDSASMEHIAGIVEKLVEK